MSVIINYINYKVEKNIEVFAFALFMFCETLFADNLLSFKHLNIMQISIKKTDVY